MNRAQRRFNKAMKNMNYNNQWDPTMIGLIILLSFIAVLIYGLHKVDVKTNEVEYNTVTQQVSSYDAVLSNQMDNIDEIRNDQYELSDELYQYTVEAVESCSDNMIQGVFKKLFPNQETFRGNDRSKGIKDIYAFLDKYPRIKGDSMVLYTIQTIDTNKIELKNKVDMYNMNVDFYNFWANEWNHSKYITSREGTVDPQKYPYMTVE